MEMPARRHALRCKTHLVGLDQNEDVVHPDRQHQEGDDLDHDEGEGDPGVAEDAQRAGHRAQHDEDARDAEGDLGIHLRCNEDKPAVSRQRALSSLPLKSSSAPAARDGPPGAKSSVPSLRKK